MSTVAVLILMAVGLSWLPVRASETTLALADFDVSGLEIELAALLMAGSEGSPAALYSAQGSRWAVSGSLVDGELGLGVDESPVVRVMSIGGGSVLRLNDSGPLVLRDFFGASGPGADLTVHIQSAEGAASFAVEGRVRSAGSNYVNFDLAEPAAGLLGGIGDGDRFVLALTRPASRQSDPQQSQGTADSEEQTQGTANTGEQTRANEQPQTLQESPAPGSGLVASAVVTFGEMTSGGTSVVAYSRLAGVGSVDGAEIGGIALVEWLGLFALGQFDGLVGSGPAAGLVDPVLLTMSPPQELEGGFWLQVGDTLLNSADSVTPGGVETNGVTYWLWDAPCADWTAGDRAELRLWAANSQGPVAAYADAALARLNVTGAALDDVFDPSVVDYTATADAGGAEVTIHAVPAASQACGVHVTPTDADPDTDGHQVALGDDPAESTLVRVTVTAADRTTGTYNVVVGRGGPRPAFARSLSLDGITDLSFDPGTRRYHARTPQGTQRTTVHAAGLGDVAVETFSITAGDTRMDPAAENGVVDLTQDRDTLVAVRASAPDIEQQAFYTVRLHGARPAPENNLNTRDAPSPSPGGKGAKTTPDNIEPLLDGLAVDGNNIAGFDPQQHEYTLEVSHDTEQITVTPTAASGVTVTITPVDADADAGGHQVDLNAAPRVGKSAQTAILITSSAGKRVDSYTLSITRRAPLSGDASLKALSLGAGTLGLDPAFASDTTAYRAVAMSTTASVTVTAKPNHANATVAISPADADPDTDDHQVSLGVGSNTVTIGVTAEDGTTLDYTITFDRAAPPLGRDPSKDIAALHPDNDHPAGIWSDGTTMWVVDHDDDKLYAYDLTTGAHQPTKDITTLADAGNRYAYGIWSDGTDVWVSDPYDDKIYVYDLATGARRANRDMNNLTHRGLRQPYGIWSDGTTMWAMDPHVLYMFAWNLSTASYQVDKVIHGFPERWGNENPAGLWSDGNFMWAADDGDDKLYAYNFGVNYRPQNMEFDTLGDAGNRDPTGIWSDGHTMWVADSEDGKIYAYNMPVLLKTLEFSDVTIGVEGWLSLSSMGLQFVDGFYRFTGRVPSTTATTTVTAAAADTDAIVTIKPDDADSETSGHQINLAPGANTITLTVANQRGVTSTYTVTITRTGLSTISSDTGLSEFSLSGIDYSLSSPPAHGRKRIAVANDVTRTTVTAVPKDPNATVSFGTPPDADRNTSGHQANLSVGITQILVTVTSTDGTNLEGHGVYINRASEATYGWDSVRDIDMPRAAGNLLPEGIWSDGATMWVTDREDDKIYAYNLATGSRQPTKDINTLDAAGNHDAAGIWSDGATIWVTDNHDDKIYAYNLATGSRQPTKDINTLDAAGNRDAAGIWSDGATIWVTDNHDDKIYAYNLATGSRQPTKDINTLGAAGNRDAFGIWSDGATMWVTEHRDDATYHRSDKIYAYDLPTGGRRPTRDIEAGLRMSYNRNTKGIWSDGATMWVADTEWEKLFAYNMPVTGVLSSLELSGVDFGPFVSDVTAYTAEVGAGVTRTTVTAVPASSGTSVRILPADADSAAQDHQVDLVSGSNTITVTVLSSRGATLRTYTVHVDRAADN